MTTLQVAYPGIDSVVDAVAAWINGAAFAQALTDVQAARGDAIDLPLPAAVIPADVNPKTLSAFPALMVIGGIGNPSDRNEPVSSEINVDVLIVVVLSGDDPVVLSKQMQRYLLALRMCFARVHSFFPLLPYGPTRIGAMRPDPTAGPVPSLNNRYLKAGTFDMTVQIDTDV